MRPGLASRQHRELATARLGQGPLLQRDYWAVIDRCRLGPRQVMELVARHFPAFAPEELVVFTRGGDEREPLRLGEVLGVHIVGAGDFEVRVIHLDPQSLTVATVTGHPEAGRITFGAYRNRRGDVIFHIRSRARSSTWARYFGFRSAGEVMQTSCWTDFVNRVAVATGRGVLGHIHATTCTCSDEEEGQVRSRPTFLARGD